MIGKLRIYFHENKKKIIVSVIFVVFLYGILRAVAGISTGKLTVNKKGDLVKRLVNIDNEKNNVNEAIDRSYISDKKTDIVDSFVKYCNGNKMQEAYNLLSDDCKKVFYPTVKDFEQKYYKNIFASGKKEYILENTDTNVILIKYLEDRMAGGNSKQAGKQDYITKVWENGKEKLNISGFIKLENIEYSNQVYNVEIKVLQKQVFYNYEKYKLVITNNNENNISIDTTNSKSIYLQDDKNLKYYAQFSRTNNNVDINSKSSKILDFRFIKPFSYNNITFIVFENIIIKNNIPNSENIRFEVSLNNKL